MTSPPRPNYRDEDEGPIILSLISQLRCVPLTILRPKLTLTPLLIYCPFAYLNHRGKQLHRVGMDLSKVTFPTFVLEPRSMLERITDFMAHPDLIFGWVEPSCTPRWLHRGTRVHH